MKLRFISLFILTFCFVKFTSSSPFTDCVLQPDVWANVEDNSTDYVNCWHGYPPSYYTQVMSTTTDAINGSYSVKIVNSGVAHDFSGLDLVNYTTGNLYVMISLRATTNTDYFLFTGKQDFTKFGFVIGGFYPDTNYHFFYTNPADANIDLCKNCFYKGRNYTIKINASIDDDDFDIEINDGNQTWKNNSLSFNENVTKVNLIYFWDNYETGETLIIDELCYSNSAYCIPLNYTPPTLSLSTSLSNGTITREQIQTFYYNGSVQNTKDIFNCTYSVDSSIKNTSLDVNVSVNNFFSYDFGSSEKWFKLNISCTNSNATDSEISYYFIDTVTPLIETSLIDNSFYFTEETLSYSVNFSDLNLYYVNHTIFKSGIIKRYDEILDLNTSNYLLNVSNLTSSLGSGDYQMFASAYDSHTLREISNGKVLGNVFYFKNVMFYCDNIERLRAIKESDRYVFDLSFSKVNSNCYLTGEWFKVSRNKAKYHYVNLREGLWFTEDNMVEWNKDYLKVTYIGLEEISNSIGELNQFTINRSFKIDSKTNILLTSINSSLLAISEDTETIKDSLEMLPIVLLYAVLLFFGYWCIRSYNFFIGLPYFISSIGFDIYFWITYKDTHTILSYVFAGITFVSIVSFYFLRGIVSRERV